LADTWTLSPTQAALAVDAGGDHSAEFKAQVVAECSVRGVSSAAVAMAHGINANLARRWVREAELLSGGAITKVVRDRSQIN